MTVDDVGLDKNTAAGAEADSGGGAIYSDGGKTDVTDTAMTANQATGAAGSGGAVLNKGGALTIKTSTLDSNKSSRAGGGIETVGGVVVLSEVGLKNNATGAAPGNGGGLH